VAGQAAQQEGTGDDEQVGDQGLGQPVHHGVARAGRVHDPRTLEDRKVLGQRRGLSTRHVQQARDRGGQVRVGRDHLQQPDPDRVGQRLEQLCLDRVERLRIHPVTLASA
jgi:hypothetical protein